jgi:hypothetical protein
MRKKNNRQAKKDDDEKKKFFSLFDTHEKLKTKLEKGKDFVFCVRCAGLCRVGRRCAVRCGASSLSQLLTSPTPHDALGAQSRNAHAHRR